MRPSVVFHLVPAGLLLAIGGCATPHPGSMARAYADPWEKTNRKVYAFNKQLDHYALLPAAKVYRKVVIAPVRHGVTNGLNNIEEPVSFINAVLQGKIKQAFRTVDRFFLNSVLGVGGLADVATDLGRPVEKEDFGQTFAVWGIKSGPFLMLPFFGPSTLRDGAGTAVEFAADPVPYVRDATLNWNFIDSVGQAGLTLLDLRSQIIESNADGFLASSLDEYATLRSAYLQNRQSLIYDGNPPDEDEALPDAPLAPGATPPGAVPTANASGRSGSASGGAQLTPRNLLVLALLALTACGASDAVAPTADAAATARASRKAVADTDAALRDAAVATNAQAAEQTVN